MTSKEIQKSIKNQNKKLIEVFRSEVDELSTLLIPVYQSPEFLCAKYASDFSCDGYRYIRSKFITDIVTSEQNETLAFFNYIYQKENLVNSVDAPYNSDTFQKLFAELAKTGESVTVECNFEDAIDYYVGKVVSLNGNLATMKCFDGSGVVFKDNVKINLDFVSMVTIGDRYTSTMAKYIKW